ncbi:hypothetical protein [Bradyrhizobium sp. USDA 10063]
MIGGHTYIYRPSWAQDDVFTTRSREIIARSFQLLEQTAKPDTFLGRQTFEPFPKEDDNP